MKKSTWIIIAITAVLALSYFLTKPKKVSVGVKKLELPVFDQAQVDRIEIQQQNNPLTLIKQDKQWFIEKTSNKPQEIRADQAAVSSMLEAIRTLSPAYYVSELEQKQAELGLSNDAATVIKLHAQNKIVWSLAVGKSDPQAGRYAKLPDDKHVFAVRGSYWQILKPRAEDWRERRLLSLLEPEVTSINFERAKKTTLALKKSDDTNLWLIDKNIITLPENFRADKNALSNLVRAALNIRAQAFVDEQTKHMPDALAKLSVKTKDAKEQHVQIYPGPGDRYLVKTSLGEQLYEINKSQVEPLFRPLSELRALNIMDLDAKSVNKIIIPGAARVVLEKSENTWKLSEPTKLPKDFEFDPQSVDSLIQLVAELKADRLANLSKDKAHDAHWQKEALIEFIGPENKKTRVFASKSKNSPENYLVQGNVDSEIYIVPRAQLLRLMRGLDAFKKEADERTQGFDSLPVEVQRKIMESMKKKKQ